MILAFILFLVFSLYRGLKSNFVLYSAISNELFTQKDFDLNIKITKNNLWRILGNFLLIGFLTSIFIVFGFVFTYIFMKRLEIESKEHTSSEIINETETIINTMDRIKK